MPWSSSLPSLRLQFVLQTWPLLEVLPPSTRLDEAFQQQLLDDLQHPLFRWAPPPTDYTRRLLSRAAALSESQGEELSEGLAEMLAQHLLNQGRSPEEPLTLAELAGSLSPEELRRVPSLGPYVRAEWRLQTYFVSRAAPSPTPGAACPLDPPHVTLHLAANMLAGSTGAAGWEAGFVLSELALNRPELFKGRNVIEIGCGSGIFGAVLARSPGSRPAWLALTDGSEAAVLNATANLKLNGSHVALEGNGAAGAAPAAASDTGPTTHLGAYRWESAPPAWLVDPDRPPHVIVAADVLYDPLIVPLAVKAIGRLLAEAIRLRGLEEEAGGVGAGTADPPPTAYVVTMLRQEATFQEFIEEAEANGLEVTEYARGPGCPPPAPASDPAGPGALQPGPSLDANREPPILWPWVFHPHASLDPTPLNSMLGARSRVVVHRLRVRK